VQHPLRPRIVFLLRRQGARLVDTASTRSDVLSVGVAQRPVTSIDDKVAAIAARVSHMRAIAAAADREIAGEVCST
jgi:hypothetical protein